jgi:hypothetical protein
VLQREFKIRKKPKKGKKGQGTQFYIGAKDGVDCRYVGGLVGKATGDSDCREAHTLLVLHRRHAHWRG